MQSTQVINHISHWLKEYCENAKMNGYVIGISGGVDSAVTSTLAAKTGFPLTVIEMPIHQAPDQVSRGKKHIEWLQENFPNVTHKIVDLTQTYDDFKSSVAADLTEGHTELALANTRSRFRMATLYYYAGKDKLLVCGTGNKVEDFGIGFFTKYGDGGVDVSPIADLMKSEVYELSRALNLIDEIQNAIPTDGLWADNRSDEDQIGATYDELEWAMSVYPEKKASDFEGREKEILQIYDRFNRAMQHKINPIPVCEIPKEFK